MGMVQFDKPAEFAGLNVYYFMDPMYYAAIASGFLGTALCMSIVGNYLKQYAETGSSQFDRTAIYKNIRSNFGGFLGVSLFYYAATLGGLVFLIIPGIYFSVANALARPAYILENNGERESMSIGKSFSESRRLITDNWWRTFGLFYILYFLVAIISFVFFIPQGILQFLIAFNSAKGIDMEGYRLYYILSSVLGQIGQGLLFPISVSAWFIYYFSLKESKDQTDLLATIDSIGAKPTTKTEDEGSY